MLKYVDTAVTFAEFPNEVSLCINISGCPCCCDGCHSPYLSKDIGEHSAESQSRGASGQRLIS
jgi:anaerobic ribonucleoside-triphosphate reductase activating protein